MAQSYTRQSSMSDGDTITASLFNDEYNQLVNAFAYSSSSASSTGHRHDGTAGHGGNIHTIGDLDFLNKIVVDSTNNRWGVFVEVSSAAVEQIRIQDGAIVPVTDNDIDLGTSSLEFKDAYFDGTVTSDAFAGPLTGDVTGNVSGTAATVTTAAQTNITSLGTLTTLTVDNVIVNGTTIGHTSDTDLLTLTSGVLTVAGELDAATLDISGDADIDGTTNLDAVDIDGAVQIDATLTVGVDDTGYDVKFFGDTASAYMLWDTSADDLVLAGAAGIDVAGDIDVDGTANLDNTDIDGTLAVDGTTISLDATTSLNIDNSNTSNGITIGTATSGVPVSIGHTTSEVTVNDNLTVTGTLTLGSGAELTEAELEMLDGITAGTVAASKAVVVDSNKDAASFRNITLTGELDAGSLDVSGDADIDGTLEADAITIGGVTLAETISDTVGAMVTSNTETGITVTYEDGDNTLDFAIGTLNQDTTGTAATVTTAAQPNITSLGTLTTLTVDNVIINGTTIGHTSDTDLITLADGNVTIAGELDLTTLDVSGDADIDGTLEADAITIGGVTLAETIADTVGAMVSSNTESGITVAYQDADNTLDFTVGTLNQDTTGTAAIATTVTITDNESTNEENAVVFTAGGDVDGGNLGLESDGNLTYNPSSGTLTATAFAGALTGNVTGNASGTAATVTGAAQSNITSLGTLTTLTVDNVIVNGTTIGHTDDTDLMTLADGVLTVAGEVSMTTLDIGGTNVTSTAAELNILDGVTSTAAELNILDGATVVVGEINALDLGSTAVGTAIASKAVILDSNKDYTGLRNLTITGELDAATLDISGDVDIDGTLETDNLTIGGAQGSDGQVLTSTGSGVAWENASGGGGGASAVNDLSDAKTFGTSSIMIGDATTGTISGANYNVGLGIDVFESLTTGDNNVGVGFRALQDLTTGEQNVSLGNSTLMQLTTASNNTAVGQSALNANTSGAGNVAVGHQTMDANTTGASNTAVGKDALGANTTGGYNTAMGASALGANTTGNTNVSIGFESLTANTTGADNVAFGVDALKANTTASNNTGVGRSALAANTTAEDNTALGYVAGQKITTASDNVIIGSRAGYELVSGHSNVVVGKDAFGYGASSGAANGDECVSVGFETLRSNTGDYNTAVGSKALRANTTGTDNVAIGWSALTANTTGADNVAIGKQSLIANTTGSNNTGLGDRTLQAVTTGGQNTAVGKDALYLNTASENTSVGTYSMDANTTGGNNVAVGYNVLGANTTGGQNTAVGHTALDANTTASDNTAFGYGALGANTTGDENVAIGKGALQAQTTAEDNTAVGTLALAATNNSRNLGVGYRALTAQSGTSDNLAIGYDALVRQTTGANGNLAIGNYAGRAVVSSASTSQLVAIGHEVAGNASGALAGYQNCFVGYNIASASGLAGAFQNTALGANAMSDLTTGDFNTGLGNHALHAMTTGIWNTAVGMDALNAITTGEYNVAVGKAAGSSLGSSSHNNICIGSNANGTGSTNSHLIVIGAGLAATNVDNRFSFGKESNVVHNDFTSNASWTRTSDERRKKNIKDDTLGLDFINDLKTVTFEWKPNHEFPEHFRDYKENPEDNMMATDKVLHGMIAQDVKAALDKAGVDTFGGWTEDPIDGSQEISQEMFVHPLIRAVQELSSKVEELENKLNNKE